MSGDRTLSRADQPWDFSAQQDGTVSHAHGQPTEQHEPDESHVHVVHAHAEPQQAQGAGFDDARVPARDSKAQAASAKPLNTPRTVRNIESLLSMKHAIASAYENRGRAPPHAQGGGRRPASFESSADLRLRPRDGGSVRGRRGRGSLAKKHDDARELSTRSLLMAGGALNQKALEAQISRGTRRTRRRADKLEGKFGGDDGAQCRRK